MSFLARSIIKSLTQTNNFNSFKGLASRAISTSKQRNDCLDNYFFNLFLIDKVLHTARVQHPAPNFEGKAVINGEFKDIKLSDFKGKYLILFFYPLDL
jgi:hypothetical protein